MQNTVRNRRREGVVVGHEHHAISGAAERFERTRKFAARIVVLADGRLVEHDPGVCAGKRPQPADPFARRQRKLIQMLIKRGNAEIACEGHNAIIGEGVRFTATCEGRAAAREVLA